MPAMQHHQFYPEDHEDSDWIMLPRSFQHHQPDLHCSCSLPVNTPAITEPQPSLPTFTGKFGEWHAFWVQFQLISERYGWTGHKLADQLLLSLKDEALLFAANLPPDRRRDATQLIQTLQRRFSPIAPTQSYTANIRNLQKKSSESLQEFAGRVQSMMYWAYPSISNTPTYDQLEMQHFIHGLPDEDLACEVLKMEPKNLHEAMNFLKWIEFCKQATRRSTLRHLRPNTAAEYGSHTPSEMTISGETRKIKDREFLSNYKTKELARLQREDPDLHSIFRLFDEEKPDKEEIANLPATVKRYYFNFDNIVQRDGALYMKRLIAPSKHGYQLLVPEALKICIIRHYHNPCLAEHHGVTKTSKKIREQFHWHQIERDVRSYVKTCDVCSSRTN